MPHTRKLSDEQIAQSVARYRAGEQSQTIAAEMGVNPTALSYHFRKHGVPKKARAMGRGVCLHCNKEFEYVLAHASKAPRLFCDAACRKSGYRGELHGNAKLTPTVQGRGYRFVRVPPDSISHQTDRRKRRSRAPEHVVIAEQALGRPLKRGEVVHHINCDPLDNRPRNLLICTRGYHAWLHGEMSRRWAREHFTPATREAA